MTRDERYAQAVIQALVTAAWAETLSRAAQTAARAAAELARARLRNR